jgi:hypothetical protein
MEWSRAGTHWAGRCCRCSGSVGGVGGPEHHTGWGKDDSAHTGVHQHLASSSWSCTAPSCQQRQIVLLACTASLSHLRLACTSTILSRFMTPAAVSLTLLVLPFCPPAQPCIHILLCPGRCGTTRLSPRSCFSGPHGGPGLWEATQCAHGGRWVGAGLSIINKHMRRHWCCSELTGWHSRAKVQTRWWWSMLSDC